MKTFVCIVTSLFLFSSCTSTSYDDQRVSLSSGTSQKIFVVKIYNRETNLNDSVSIGVQNASQESAILKPQQVATFFLDELDAGKNEPILVFLLSSGEEIKSVLPANKTIEKNIAPQINDKVYICIENGTVSQLSSEEWYGKLNKDRESSPSEQALMLVTAPITIPVFLASYMVITLVGSIVE